MNTWLIFILIALAYAIFKHRNTVKAVTCAHLCNDESKNAQKLESEAEYKKQFMATLKG